jgi:hypothetical protein
MLSYVPKLLETIRNPWFTPKWKQSDQHKFLKPQIDTSNEAAGENDERLIRRKISCPLQLRARMKYLSTVLTLQYSFDTKLCC